ncbi:nicotinate phosphoribosyltransferase [Guyanagaster necrorhizus]|uniref:Nicotinate phosphoribosyltransferase n=1 Tax=Guyanagaster necrorhizus TaxID=856835 RepID=A0A9P7W1S8_9AGAR|nr:nicotinate phosphoribosyltransferase [Guyanagaster necrorhizus MCA 3950]KAG7451014.1 nicotinate phosphoribosyltransferase [Guyanagaster necrorhizus MCA 3950]
MSILDTDLYKLTMQAAVLDHFPMIPAVYKFTLRDKQISFTPHFVDVLKGVISHFTGITLQPDERDWLQSACSYFTPAYIDYLSAYRFKPEQVQITFVPSAENSEQGTIDVVMSGPWVETILWEVPILACISETYYNTIEEDWNYDRQDEIAYSKAKALQEGGCVYMEFGTRRRRTFHAQDIMVSALVRASGEVQGKGRLMGTSNVHLAHKYGVAPMGTIAHEWFMGVAALKGYETANSLALELWEQTFPNSKALIALTDTFSTGAFFDSFVKVPDLAGRWTGLRQDSGDPFTFSLRAKAVYEKMGIDHRTKTITFSDALDIDKALKLQKQSEEIGFKASFGIGTFLSNDFVKASSGGKEKSRAINMVIKLASVDGKPCVKISDDLTKNTGDEAEVQKVKRIFGLPV